MKTIWERNQNELSKYFYDISKTVLAASIVLPIFQEKSSLKFTLVGGMITVISLLMGMIFRRNP